MIAYLSALHDVALTTPAPRRQPAQITKVGFKRGICMVNKRAGTATNRRLEMPGNTAWNSVLLYNSIPLKNEGEKKTTYTID